MRVPEPPYPSFAQVMLMEHPIVAPPLFPSSPSRASDVDSVFGSDASSFTSYGQELTRRSVEEDMFMYTVDYRDEDVPPVHRDDVLGGGLANVGSGGNGNGARGEDDDGTFFQLEDALTVDRLCPPTRSLIRRRLSRLIVDLAAKVVFKFKSRSSSTSSSSRTR